MANLRDLMAARDRARDALSVSKAALREANDATELAAVRVLDSANATNAADAAIDEYARIQGLFQHHDLIGDNDNAGK
jgi:hypothetical protein